MAVAPPRSTVSRSGAAHGTVVGDDLADGPGVDAGLGEDIGGARKFDREVGMKHGDCLLTLGPGPDGRPPPTFTPGVRPAKAPLRLPGARRLDAESETAMPAREERARTGRGGRAHPDPVDDGGPAVPRWSVVRFSSGRRCAPCRRAGTARPARSKRPCPGRAPG